MKIRNFIFLIAIMAFLGLSALYSRQFYKFYLKAYHIGYKKESPSDMLKQADELYKKKDYKKFRSYAEKMLLVYPNSADVRIYVGLHYMRIGDDSRGPELLISAMNDAKMKEDELEMVVSVLFEQKYYGEVISFLERADHALTREMEFYYGVSLLKTGRDREAIAHLVKSRDRGNDGFDLNISLGRAYENTGNLNEALKSYEAAATINPRDRNLRESLVSVYRKLGRYDQAERIIREK